MWPRSLVPGQGKCTCPKFVVLPTMFSARFIKLALHDGPNKTFYGVVLISIPDRPADQFKADMGIFLPCLQAKGGKQAAPGLIVVYHFILGIQEIICQPRSQGLSKPGKRPWE